MKRLMGIALLMLAGCASQTGIVPAGADSYMVSRQDGGITGALGTLKAENMREASEFCAKKGKTFAVQSSDDVPRALGKIPQSTLYFKCT